MLNLLKLSGAHRLLITGTTLRELLQGTKELVSSNSELPYEVIFEEVPSLGQLYPEQGMVKAEANLEYPWVESSYPKPEETAVYLHSSGSTGLPKAIPVSHGMMVHSFCESFALHRPPVTHLTAILHVCSYSLRSYCLLDLQELSSPPPCWRHGLTPLPHHGLFNTFCHAPVRFNVYSSFPPQSNQARCITNASHPRRHDQTLSTHSLEFGGPGSNVFTNLFQGGKIY